MGGGGMSNGKPRFEAGEYKGFPVGTVYTGHSYQGKAESVTAGKRKWRAVLECIDDIRAWLDDQEAAARKDGDMPF